jgi:hypothetical protein
MKSVNDKDLPLSGPRSLSIRPNAANPGVRGASDGTATTLELVAPLVPRFVKRRTAFLVRRGECTVRASEQRAIVAFQFEREMAAHGSHDLGHLG